jgi:hypothetical protein
VVFQIPRTAEEVKDLEAGSVKDAERSMREDNNASELRQTRIEEEESFCSAPFLSRGAMLGKWKSQ